MNTRDKLTAAGDLLAFLAALLVVLFLCALAAPPPIV